MQRGYVWFQEFIQMIEYKNCHEMALTQAHSKYHLKSFNLRDLTPHKIQTLFSYLNTKFYQSNLLQYQDAWAQNQLRIFIWTLICYSYTENKSITDINSCEWDLLSSVFNHKNPLVLEYQSKFLLKSTLKSRKWTTEEATILTSIIEEKQVKNKWNQIAKSLFLDSNKRYFRTPKQCREHWINHLDPSKLKSSWSLKEDFELIKSVMESGKKWSKISRELKEKRTEHMVKNRFKSLINLEKKRLSEELDEEILIKKVFQRLQSCQSLKQLQAMKKEKKNEEIQEKTKVQIEPVENEIDENMEQEWKWQSEPQLNEKIMNIEVDYWQNECINFFSDDCPIFNF